VDHEVTTIAGLFLDTVARHGSRAALVEAQSTITYDELRRRVLRAASTLLSAGVAKGDRVAIWLPNGLEWIETGLAAALVGAVVVPISTRLKGDEVAYILKKARPKVVIAVGEFLGLDYTRLLDGQDLPSIEARFRVGAGDPNWTDWTRAVASAMDEREAAILEMARSVRPADVAEIMFTSGTTGFPKGAMLVHSQIVKAYRLWAERLRLGPTDKYLIIAPMFHSFGYKAGVIACVTAGAAMYPLATFDAAKVLQIIESEGITVTGGPPTIFLALLDENRAAQRNVSSLRAIGTGGNVVPPSMIRALRREASVTTVLNAYGLTESTALVTVTDPNDDSERIALTAGTVIDGVQVRCADLNNQPVAPGEVGEIQVKGYNVMAGYFEDDEATRSAMTADGWLKTGDVGVLDELGYLRITDRMKDMYVVGGFNCYPAEIERVILEHPVVDEAAVIGIPDERMGEVGKAFIVASNPADFDAGQFLSWCRQRMANYKVPREVKLVEALPRNAMGKVQKFLLRT
jgi:acyl-CoA synthetase (AMP-forming)/AMP-acid ligase II